MTNSGDAAGPQSSTPDTVTEALTQLASEGYTEDYRLRNGALVPSSASDDAQACPVDKAIVERMYRFEGASDPGDEMVVFGIRDPHNDLRGTLASGFGLAADPEVLDQLSYLASRVDAHEP